MTHIKDYILSKKFGGGIDDWDFLEKLTDDFEMDEGQIDLMIEEEKTDINQMIDYCFEAVIVRLRFELPKLNKYIEQRYSNLSSSKREKNWSFKTDGKWYSIFTNCLDSHLYLFNEQAYNYKEAKEIVEKNLKRINDEVGVE